MTRPVYRQFVELGDAASVRRFQARHQVLVSTQEQKDVRQALEQWAQIRAREWKRVGRAQRAELNRERAVLARTINRRLVSSAVVRLTGDLANLAIEPALANPGAAVVWIALALAIVGKGSQRDCPVCGDLFAPARADARFCSGACRVAAHRGANRID